MNKEKRNKKREKRLASQPAQLTRAQPQPSHAPNLSLSHSLTDWWAPPLASSSPTTPAPTSPTTRPRCMPAPTFHPARSSATYSPRTMSYLIPSPHSLFCPKNPTTLPSGCLAANPKAPP